MLICSIFQVFVDYANMEFPGAEFTIELGGVCIPEIGSVGLEELISSGRLVFIQAGDDQDADKENMHCQSSEIVKYLIIDEIKTIKSRDTFYC